MRNFKEVRGKEMKNNPKNASSVSSKRDGEKGSAIVIALFVLVLLAGFVALATTRTASEAMSVANETAEGRALYAAQGSLEMMTRKLRNIYGKKLRATESDLLAVRDDSEIRAVEGFDRYEFDQKIGDLFIPDEKKYEVVTGGAFSGLQALRSPHRLSTTVTDPNGIQVELARNVIVNRIPIFQFGIFYDDDLELFRPPLFSFGGRVHSNRHFFLSPGAEGVYFDSRITAAGHIVTESWRTGYSGDNYNTTRIKDADGDFQILNRNEGSVRNGAGNLLRNEPTPKCTAVEDFPGSISNPNWSAAQSRFGGNLQNRAPELKLPLKVGNDCASMGDLIEIIKRPKNTGSDMAVTDATKNDATPTVTTVTAANADDEIMKSERYANKPGIRISLADSKRRLPGCANAGTGVWCGVRLDGDASPGPDGTLGDTVGYRPRPMGTYQATRFNAQLFRQTQTLPEGSQRQIWIKVEKVDVDRDSDNIITHDITEEFLSLGVTEEAPAYLNVTTAGYTGIRAADLNGSEIIPGSNLTATNKQSTVSTFPDSRSVIKLQRFVIPGRLTSEPVYHLTGTGIQNRTSSSRYHYALQDPIGVYIRSGTGAFNDDIAAIPIKMFDGREGLFYDNRATAANGNTTDLPVNGVMSMVDIDVANLRRLLRGDFDGLFPTGTTFNDITGNTLSSDDFQNEIGSPIKREDGGWVLYVSDRRGDYDFDGEWDMEDVYGPTDGVMQNGEDANGNGVLDVRRSSSRGWEGADYTTARISPGEAATRDHLYYRRGVRLINGTVLPGVYDVGMPRNTKGFTVASENGVYVKGNYNATGVTSVPSTGNTPYNNYSPFNTATHIPASIVADGVTILSNAWNDAQSFTTALAPANPSQSRVPSNTTIRFAMISGDTIATRLETPHQGSTASGERTNGGVHNFKRFLEDWVGATSGGQKRLDYAGSLINLFNSRNNSTPFKCCALVYNPPRRNWVFDSTFLDPNRLPPGTPMFHYVQTTGFMRTNE